ncbi:MAG: MFS transporter [Clostridia bacterium]|nr:MFS transporter [Clostridia bacterium]
MKLNYKKTIFVGFAFFLISMFWQVYDTLVPKILTDKFGMAQTWSGVIMALDNVFALFLLPIFGAISDKVNSKHGRRTPFIFLGTILAAALLMTVSIPDAMQRRALEDVSATEGVAYSEALDTLWDHNPEILDWKNEDDTEKYPLQSLITEQEFKSITLTVEVDGEEETNPLYVGAVVPARQAYAATVTASEPAPLILFIVLLFLLLVSMGTFRSPAVALMPDVTVKPLRSKANAIINLMGTAGGIIVLVLGMVFGTGKSANALMSYTPFFVLVAGLMLAALAIFLLTVNEPKLVEEMREESRRFGIDEEKESAEAEEKLAATRGVKLGRPEFISLLLILASVALWYMGYNAVTSKYSVYAGAVLGLDYNSTLIIAQSAAIVAYIPAGIIASKFGRRKTILGGVVLLFAAFLFASFLRAGSPAFLVNLLFIMAGIGWATINVNSFPMVVELSKSADVGRYTGFYYTASMSAQILTPVLSGVFLDTIGMTTLFPYAAVFVALAFLTMLFVRHGDSKPTEKKSALESLGADD